MILVMSGVSIALKNTDLEKLVPYECSSRTTLFYSCDHFVGIANKVFINLFRLISMVGFCLALPISVFVICQTVPDRFREPLILLFTIFALTSVNRETYLFFSSYNCYLLGLLLYETMIKSPYDV